MDSRDPFRAPKHVIHYRIISKSEESLRNRDKNLNNNHEALFRNGVGWIPAYLQYNRHYRKNII